MDAAHHRAAQADCFFDAAEITFHESNPGALLRRHFRNCRRALTVQIDRLAQIFPPKTRLDRLCEPNQMYEVEYNG
jgi:hypothetical protein